MSQPIDNTAQVVTPAITKIDPAIAKADAYQKQLSALSAKVNSEAAPTMYSAYNAGRGNQFSAKQFNQAKYATYGSEIYGKLGFNPYQEGGIPNEKSGMDVLYDTNTTTSNEYYRASKGMLKLAGIGVQDTFGLNAFASDKGYLDFEDVMNKYSSSRGGVAGFVANTMVSAGYTVGIIGGIAAEELALAGITALTGGAASVGTIAAGGTALVRGLDRLKNLGKTKSLLSEVRSLENVEDASTWLGRGLKSKVKALGPGNTYDFLKNVDAIKDLNGWKQTALGVGAVVRDARKITMAHSESKLEADLARKEFVEQSINDYYEDKDNVGKPMSDKHQRLIESESTKLHDRTYTANFGLIYVTNAIVFDNMFKNMRGTNKFFKSSASEFFKTTRNVLTGKIAVSPLAKTLGNMARKKLATLSVTGTLKKATVRALEGSIEGGQELGQDLIANSMKSYHARNVKGTQLRGGFFDLLDQDISKAAKDLYSEQGGITFLSGALMGVFAAPAGYLSGKVSSYLTQGGINNSFNYVTNQKEYKAKKATLQTQRLEKAKRLTEFFNDNKNFIDGFSNGVYTQNELQEQILKAGEEGNLKEFKNKQHESFVNGVHSLLEAGLEKDFADHLDYMGNNFDAEHLNEVFGRTDITDATKGKYQQKLKDNAKTVRTLRKTYVDIQDKIINPNSMKGLKVTDEKYLPTYIKYRAFENFKKELLFSHANIADRATRLQEVHKEISNETPLTQTEANALIDPKALADHIQMLEIEVSANKDLNLKGDAAISAKQAVTKLEAYKNYQVEYKKHLDTIYNGEGVVYESDSFDALAEAYNNVIKSHDGYRLVLNNINANDDTDVTETNNQAYAKLFDYINMSEEKSAYEEHVKTLMNPSGSEALIKNNEDFLARLDANKEEHIKNALEAFEEKTVSDEMLNELYNEGLFFDLNEIDNLIKNRVMPSQIYDINNNQKATPEQVKRAQEIIGAHIKRLTGKLIVNAKSTKINQGRKYVGDKRTLATLVRNFKLKIGTQIKLSSKEGQALLGKILDDDNKFLTDVDREILLKVLDQDTTIKFVTDGIFPVQITDNGVIELDLRFASQDFVNSKLSFENLLTTGLVQKHISDKLKEDDDLWLATRNAMEQARDVYTARYPGENIEELEIFERPELFLTEAMNDIGFQDFLSDITDTLQPTSKSLWDTMMSNVKEITKKDFDKKLINRVINIAAKALDSSIIENISETTTAITPEMLAAAKAKEEELRKVATELGLRWNVNVKVVSTQAEANEILGTIQDPFFQKFNDILSDLMYGSAYREFKVSKGLTEVSLKDLLKSIYDNSESTVELIANLKELSLYQTNGRFTEMVDWLATNGDNIADGIQAIKNVFFQAEGETTSGFYDEKTNTAYIVADAVKPTTAYHEIFLHPFLINQEKSNPEFYKSLVAEAMNNAEVVAYVEKNYGTIEKIGARQFEHELIGRVYDLNINNQLDKVKNANLIQKLGELIKKMFSNIAKWLGINKGDIKRFNEKKTTIADLAKYSVKEETSIDLGKVIEADISYVKPPAKTKTTVTKTSTIVTPTRVNKGGNVITTENARDRKDIFGEFIHPEIKSDDTALIQEWTNKITEIGQALDAANITDWKYGQIRADVFGRLVIDVSAEIPVMATTTSTTNTASANFVKLQDELKAIEERIANLSKATSGATQDASYIANQEFEAAQKVINFSRNTFPGNKMPLYQYLRMLNNTIPVVGQFAYHVNRDNTTDPFVEKRGIITSTDGELFTYINQEGNSITDTTKSKTLEFDNNYFLFADSEVVNDLTYLEAEAFIRSRRDAKIKNTTGTTDAKADVILPIGTSGSGKSTFIKSLPQENLVVISPDDMRVEFTGDINNKSKDKEIYEEAAKRAVAAIQQGKQVVFDTTNLTKDKRRPFIEAIKKAIPNANIQYKLMELNPELAKQRIKAQIARGENRANVSDETIDRHAESYKQMLEDIKSEGITNYDTETTESQANPNAQKIAELENQKKDLEEKLKNEPEFIAFDQAQSVQTGTKTVKFLMYKSTGTGSTAASLGEWVPMLAFGEHRDGREWFVKGLHEGVDPKLNKYGSVTFADISEDLKSREDALFVNENWVTEDVESIVTEEVEVEEETTEPSAITERIRQDATSLKAQFDSKSAEFERLTNDLNGSSANFRQRLQIKSQLLALAIEINDLAKQLEDAGPLLDEAIQEEIFGNEEIVYTPKYDYNDNEIVTHETPWMTIPLDLRTTLATLYGKAVNRLAQSDVDEIRKNMKSNPAYITVISDFSNDRLNKQNQEIGKIESIENQKKTAASNAANQLRIDAQRAQDRLDKKIARDTKPELTSEELMKSLLPNLDYSILTAKEIDKLVAKLRDTKALVPFTVNDIIAYISEKKRKKALVPDAKRNIELNLIEEAKQAVIKENLKVLYQKQFGYVNSKNKSIHVSLGDDMIKFIIFYHPEIFNLPKLEFINEISMIVKNRAYRMKNYKVVRTALVIQSGMGAGPIEFKKENIAEQLVALVEKLEKEKTLFPSVAKLINLALFEAGSDLRLFIAKSKNNATLSSMYTIGNKRNYTAKPKVKNGNYGNLRALVKDQEFEFDADLNMQIALVQYFTSTAKKNKITLSVLRSMFPKNSTEIEDWMHVVSDDDKKADMNITTFDGFADYVFEAASIPDEQWQEDGKDAVEKFFLNNSNLTDAIKNIGEQVLVKVRERDGFKDPLDDENYDAEEFMQDLVSKGFTKEEAYAALQLLTFLNTDEGKEIKEEEAKALSEFYNSTTFLIFNGEFKGNYDDLSESDKALYDEINPEPVEEEDASGKEDMGDNDDDFGPKREVETPISKQIQLFYQDSTDITVPFGKQISNIWAAINGNQQGNIVYAIAAYKYIDEHRASTPARKTATTNILNEAFTFGRFSDVIVNYENKAYRIDGYDSGKIRMQDLENSNVYNDVSLEEFMTGTIEELQVGDEFNNMKINSFAKVQEIQYIKEAYNEIFNNFTKYIGEADALSDDVLLQDLRTEITKCK